jgi:hypothetical protein
MSDWVTRVKIIAIQASSLAVVGGLLGAIAGWVGHLSQNGALDVARVASYFYPLLFVITPSVLALYVFGDIQSDVGMVYHHRGRTMIMLLISGVVVALTSSFAFFVGASITPTVFGGEDIAKMQSALWDRYSIEYLLIILATSLLGAGITARRIVQKFAGQV